MTNANQFPPLRLAALVNPQDGSCNYRGPFEGFARLDWTGPDEGLIERVDIGESNTKNPSLIIWCRGDNGGYLISKTVPYTGTDTKQGGPLESQALAVLQIVRSDWFKDTDAMKAWILQQVQQGVTELPPAWIAEQISGRRTQWEIGEFQSNQGQTAGQWLTSLDRFIDREEFEKKIKTPGSGRRPRPKHDDEPQARQPVGGGMRPPTGLQNIGGPQPMASPSALGPVQPPRGPAGPAAGGPFGGAPFGAPGGFAPPTGMPQQFAAPGGPTVPFAAPGTVPGTAPFTPPGAPNGMGTMPNIGVPNMTPVPGRVG